MVTTSIPNYALYGDQAQSGWRDMVHFERIHERSSLHHFNIEPHFHEGLLQLLYITSGSGKASIDGANWSVSTQTLIVVPARCVQHAWQFTSDIDGPVVTAAQRPLESIAAVTAPELLQYIRHPVVLRVPDAVRCVDTLMPLFDAIAREMRMHASGEMTAGTALLLAVFVQIARLAASMHASTGIHAAQKVARSRKAEQVGRFRALVDQHFRKHLPVEHYAAELGLTAGHLSRLCREILGRSSHDVIKARIVHEAKRELVYSILSVKQIAHLLGFADDAYFGRFFRKQTGHTPTQFRQAAWLRLGSDDALSVS